MRRLKEYARFLTWNFGLSYIALWALTFWTLDYGQAVFSHSGICHPDPTTVLFYWVCDRTSPMSVLATLANTALTLTVWGPVYIAAATVKWDAIPIAAPILGVHLIGLATAILITTRLMLAFFQILRRLLSRQSGVMPETAMPIPDQPETTTHAVRRTLSIKSREVFGLRGTAKG